MAEEESLSTDAVENPEATPSPGFAFQLPEAIVHAIDRQIVSSGLRLIMFLPACAAVTYFLSWAFSQSSPVFWEENIAPNLGLGFSSFMSSMTFVVLVGYILAVGFHRLQGEHVVGHVSRAR